MDNQEKEVSAEEVESLPGMSFRVVVTPRDEESMLMFLQCHPRSTAQLTEDVQARNLELDSFSIPVFNINNGDLKATPIALFPLEDPNNSTGFSVRPFLMVPGAAQVKLPPTQELKNELMALMRSAPLPVHIRDVATVYTIATSDADWPINSRELTRLWPEPAPQLGTGNNKSAIFLFFLMWTITGLKTKAGKYSGLLGPFNENSTLLSNIDPSLHGVLVSALNCSQSEASWRQYDSVVKGLGKLTAETGICFSLPWDESRMLSYMLVLAKRGLKMSSVKVYLSRVKMAHRFKGLEMPHSTWTPMLLKGLAALGSTSVPRMAMTPGLVSVTLFH